jgi:predicted transcriptional regulator
MVRPTNSPKGVTVKWSITVSPESAAKMETYCDKKDRQRSWVIDQLIARYLEKLP